MAITPYQERTSIVKETGITRQLDSLGRIVIPKELRRTFQIEEGDYLEFYVEGDRMVLEKYQPTCTFCHSDQDLVEYKGKNICRKCLQALQAQAAPLEEK